MLGFPGELARHLLTSRLTSLTCEMGSSALPLPSFPPISFDPTTIGMDNCELRLPLGTQAEKRRRCAKRANGRDLWLTRTTNNKVLLAKEALLELAEDVFDSQIRSVCLLAYILSRKVT